MKASPQAEAPSWMTPAIPPGPGFGARVARFFFMHLGTLVAVVVYFQIFDRGGRSVEALRTALWTGVGVQSGYMALAYWRGEHKHFDVGVWLLFAIGGLASLVGIAPVLELYQRFSPALLFVSFALCASLPLILGSEPFTLYYARRSIPRWQLEVPETAAVSRTMAGYWSLVFLAAAALCVVAPNDPLFTLVYPNLLIFAVGMPAQFWLPSLYFRIFPPSLPRSIVPLLLGMPLAFNREAAGDARACIQFEVSGLHAGSWWLRIASGRCESFEGRAPTADLVVSTPEHVWVGIAHGEIDGELALAQGLYRVEGDYAILPRMGEWFRPGRKP